MNVRFVVGFSAIVDEAAEAVAELKGRGLELLQDTKVETWGQAAARLVSPEGLVIGVVYTPMSGRRSHRPSCSSRRRSPTPSSSSSATTPSPAG